jgi:hypothetical protein
MEFVILPSIDPVPGAGCAASVQAERNRSFALFLILFPYLCAQDAGIEGIAIDAFTRQPLEAVHVTIYGFRANVPPVETYGAMSGRDGHFSIVGMRPGKYGLRARRNGFFRIEKPNSQLVLSSGERKSGLTVEMTPEAVITGRVVDDYGDPAQALVRATPVPPNDPDLFAPGLPYGFLLAGYSDRRLRSKPVFVPRYADDRASGGRLEDLAGDDQSQGTPAIEPRGPIHTQLDTRACREDIG